MTEPKYKKENERIQKNKYKTLEALTGIKEKPTETVNISDYLPKL